MKFVRSLLAVLVVLSVCSVLEAAQTIYPTKDGTLVDGDVFGPRDGVADAADWSFNESSYEGSITLTAATEHRVVWEYSLAAVSLTPPVSAMLHVTLRGAPVWSNPPRPDAPVHVYAYPADLVESLTDFDQGPAELQAVLLVAAWLPPPEIDFEVDVSGPVSDALSSGADKIGIRFQIDPLTTNVVSEAFIDALDSNQTTKPYLVIDVAPSPPGDVNGDGTVDLDDYAQCEPCLLGPEIAPTTGCQVCDFDEDGDVDLGDFQLFQTYFTTN